MILSGKRTATTETTSYISSNKFEHIFGLRLKSFRLSDAKMNFHLLHLNGGRFLRAHAISAAFFFVSLFVFACCAMRSANIFPGTAFSLMPFGKLMKCFY